MLIMSHVCIQFGQCGNQLGHEFFSAISDDINSTKTGITSKKNSSYCLKSKDKWFRERSNSDKLTARAVLIDTESKVIKNVFKQLKSNSFWGFDNDNCINEHFGGAANNWALGYCVQGPRISEESLELVRKECEQCDRLQSILCFSSSSGGTGSGVGSYITEQLRDELPNKFVMNIVVLPYKSGEVVTQNYNSLFSLSKLYDKSDGIFLIENDIIHTLTTRDMKIKNVMYSDINSLIAQQIASIYQPLTTCSNITDSILNLVSHSSYKILTVKTAPHGPLCGDLFEDAPKWETLKRSIERTLREPIDFSVQKAKSRIEINRETIYPKSIGSVLIFRGLDAASGDGGMVMNKNSWIQSLPTSSLFHDNRKFLNKNRFFTVITNNTLVTSVLDDFISKSWNTFTHNAYVHQFSKYGIDNEQFLEMFLKMEGVLKNYKSL